MKEAEYRLLEDQNYMVYVDDPRYAVARFLPYDHEGQAPRRKEKMHLITSCKSMSLIPKPKSARCGKNNTQLIDIDNNGADSPRVYTSEMERDLVTLESATQRETVKKGL